MRVRVGKKVSLKRHLFYVLLMFNSVLLIL